MRKIDHLVCRRQHNVGFGVDQWIDQVKRSAYAGLRSSAATAWQAHSRSSKLLRWERFRTCSSLIRSSMTLTWIGKRIIRNISTRDPSNASWERAIGFNKLLDCLPGHFIWDEQSNRHQIAVLC